MLVLPFVASCRCAAAPRTPGPCSEWFDNAWLKSRGYSADVCCWRNHSDCWQRGHSYSTCCGDYDTREYERLLVSVSHAPGEDGARADSALPPGGTGSTAALAGTSLDGRLPEGWLSSGPEGFVHRHADPREFFAEMAPSAALAARLAGEAAEERREMMGGALVIFVMTAPGNFARRQAIRRTWLGTLAWPGAVGIRYAFVAAAPDATTAERIPGIAKELQEEQVEFADLLLLPLEDVYWGWEHTAKTFLALVAVLARMPTAMYYACLHDDVYVHLPRLLELLASVAREHVGRGLYLGNAYLGHDFVGHSHDDGPAYEAMHGHRKMPPVMKGGLWVVDGAVARWVAAMMSGPATLLPWRLWPSDDDSVGLVFGELDIRREHALRHGIEWFDWRLGDRCDGERLVIAHDLKTPRELFEIWLRQLVFGDPCYGFGSDGAVRSTSRPEDFGPSSLG